MIAKFAMASLNAGNSLPRAADEGRKTISPVFIVAADESQQMQGETLAHALEENGITTHGVDVLNNAKEAKSIVPEKLEIRFPKGTNEDAFLSRLAETVKKFTARNPTWSALQTRTTLIREPTRFGFPSVEPFGNTSRTRQNERPCLKRILENKPPLTAKEQLHRGGLRGENPSFQTWLRSQCDRTNIAFHELPDGQQRLIRIGLEAVA
jgi:hypothetical protein